MNLERGTTTFHLAARLKTGWVILFWLQDAVSGTCGGVLACWTCPHPVTILQFVCHSWFIYYFGKALHMTGVSSRWGWRTKTFSIFSGMHWYYTVDGFSHTARWDVTRPVLRSVSGGYTSTSCGRVVNVMLLGSHSPNIIHQLFHVSMELSHLHILKKSVNLISDAVQWTIFISK